MVGAEVLDLADGSGEAHGEVQQQVTLVRLRTEPGQVADVMCRSVTPGEDDDERQEETASGIEPPDLAIETDCAAVLVVVLIWIRAGCLWFIFPARENLKLLTNRE